MSPARDDNVLVAAAQSGDRAAMDELLRRHYDRIAAISRRVTGNAADADDATQLALMAIVRGLPKFDGRSAFSTWSYRVATNACLDELRRRKRRPTPILDDDRDTPAATPVDHRASNFDHDFVENDALSTALEQLPEQFREPVLLRDCVGLDYAEIAEKLGIPPGTVRSRIARGRSKLAELVKAGNQPGTDERPTTRP